MSGRSRCAAGGLALVALVATLTGCASAGDLEVFNEGPDDVMVLTGDEELEVTHDGGAVLLDYGCTPGDVTVEFPSGESVVLAGPVCPEQRIVIGDGVAELRPASADET